MKLDERLARVKQWRDMIGSYKAGPDETFREWIEQQPAFTTLKPHLSAAYRRDLYDTTTWHAHSGGALEPLHDCIIDEIARIEREWGLI